MTVISDSRGRKLSQIIESRAKKLIDNLKKETSKEVTKIVQEEVNNISNWSVSSEIMKTDPDLFRAPLNDKYSSDKSLSVQDAVRIDSSTPNIIANADEVNVSIGNIEQLLKMSSRILYFEFGTLSYSEISDSVGKGKYSISDFDVWENPYINRSKLASSGNINSWGFLSAEGKGRFGLGYMVPTGKFGIKSFQGIKPVRMYRGSMLSIEQRINKSFKDILQKAKGKM